MSKKCSTCKIMVMTMISHKSAHRKAWPENLAVFTQLLTHAWVLSQRLDDAHDASAKKGQPPQLRTFAYTYIDRALDRNIHIF